jgi:hypothetical protein
MPPRQTKAGYAADGSTPPLPPEPAVVTTRAELNRLYKARARKGFALRHPEDVVTFEGQLCRTLDGHAGHYDVEFRQRPRSIRVRRVAWE